MPPYPSVGVIIPTYNRRHTIGRALDSVINQSLPVTEIIVVDDGSTDSTVKFIDNCYPQVTVIQQQNQGVSVARNRGLAASSSEWIALLDSDDEWVTGKIEKQLQSITDNPNTILCHTNERWIRNGMVVNQKKKHKKSGGFIFKNCLPFCVISPSSSLIHYSLFSECGLFDETLPACEDYDMWLRICSRYPVTYIDEPLIIKYGGHDDQLSKKHWGLDRFRIQALNKLLQECPLEDSDRQAAIKVLVEKCEIVVNGAKKRSNESTACRYTRIREQYKEVLTDMVNMNVK